MFEFNLILFEKKKSEILDKLVDVLIEKEANDLSSIKVLSSALADLTKYLDIITENAAVNLICTKNISSKK